MTPARPHRKLNPRLTRLRRLLVKQLAAEGIVTSRGITLKSYIDITHRDIALLLGVSARTVTTYVGGKPQKSGTGRR